MVSNKDTSVQDNSGPAPLAKQQGKNEQMECDSSVPSPPPPPAAEQPEEKQQQCKLEAVVEMEEANERRDKGGGRF